MFIGHVAVALGAKKASPKTSFGTLLLAAQWPDLIWPLFLMLGWERVRIRGSAHRSREIVSLAVI